MIEIALAHGRDGANSLFPKGFGDDFLMKIAKDRKAQIAEVSEIEDFLKMMSLIASSGHALCTAEAHS